MNTAEFFEQLDTRIAKVRPALPPFLQGMVGGPVDAQRSAGICAGLLPPCRSISLLPGGSWDAPGRRRAEASGSGEYVRRKGSRWASRQGLGSTFRPMARLCRRHGIKPQFGVAQSGAGGSSAHPLLSSTSQRKVRPRTRSRLSTPTNRRYPVSLKKKNVVCARCIRQTTRPVATSQCMRPPMCTMRRFGASSWKSA